MLSYLLRWYIDFILLVFRLRVVLLVFRLRVVFGFLDDVRFVVVRIVRGLRASIREDDTINTDGSTTVPMPER